MKTGTYAKLLTLVLFSTVALGCESKQSKNPENTTAEVEEVNISSPLRQQIQIMLEGKPHDEASLKVELEKQKWEETFAILKEELKKYAATHGKKPEKKNTALTYAILSRVQSEIKKEKALKSLDNTIKRAIENENRVKP